MYGVTGYGQRPYGYIKWQDVYVTDPNGTGSSQTVSLNQSQSKIESVLNSIAVIQSTQLEIADYITNSSPVTITQVNSVSYNIVVLETEQIENSSSIDISLKQVAGIFECSEVTSSNSIGIPCSNATVVDSTSVSIHYSTAVVGQGQTVSNIVVQESVVNEVALVQGVQRVIGIEGSAKTEAVVTGSAVPQSVSTNPCELRVNSVVVSVGVVYKASVASCEALIDSIEVRLDQTQLIGLGASREVFEGDVVTITSDSPSRQEIEIFAGSQSSNTNLVEIVLSCQVNVKNCNQVTEVKEVNTLGRKDFNPSNLKVTLLSSGFTIFNVTKHINARNETKRISIRR